MTFEELREIIARDDVQSLTGAINAGDDVNMVCDGNYSLLMEAASMGSVNCTNLLIQRGANVNHQSNYNYTALIKAAECAKIACVDLLLQAGADPELRDNSGHNALMHAYLGGMFDQESRDCMEVLLNDPRTNINAEDGAGVNLLDRVVSNSKPEAVEFLLNHGADFTIANSEGFAPLQMACRALDLGCIRAFQNFGIVLSNEDNVLILNSCNYVGIAWQDFWLHGYEPADEGGESDDDQSMSTGSFDGDSSDDESLGSLTGDMNEFFIHD